MKFQKPEKVDATHPGQESFRNSLDSPKFIDIEQNLGKNAGRFSSKMNLRKIHKFLEIRNKTIYKAL